ncbi:myosin heavy chain 95F-like isoform X1 [Vespa mandarinia]|uniref:myosin heavy chain 95F-like isoform X1 n=1 Tax=Vespa mandarinia TaxID=7446 RepID=UPI00160AA399|nr:myosin heavy chain 95F-like isoform X1 [Vespa mandarinia]XP_035731797.1 myosin heavy chain 95F-like isoform X1 [Vespa mandarinia]XP_035731798.1 myosin heavy chain 95F-like isoform X1 [Vespa mandarinia]XP_035731799.1 myosin heavy chain 95F-like isoform X1 [Vespa mandarinia]XP_035731800.1 myosin heavy chain 95F-like isoform X1 [Vespa mandarinia]
MENQQVWVRDPQEGFIIGKFTDMLDGDALILPLELKYPQRTCPLDEVYPAGEYTKDVEDNCALMYLNEATLLNNIRTRYFKDRIYTYVANILIAVNPYCQVKNLYSPETIKTYKGKSLGETPPHVFAIADKAFRDMKVLKQSQSIIVSGESGAGKTESTKYLLRYLCDLWGSTAGPIEQKILDANPVLEAFGNAKTKRNNNSSRFGKFMEVHFDAKCQVVGGYISHYLLEKSRVCLQSPDERNYHVFYMMCAGAPPELRSKLGITKPDDFHYLKNGSTQYFCSPESEKKLNDAQKSSEQMKKGSLSDPYLDDVEGFNAIDQALTRLGLTDAERMEIYTMVAAVLHLGNITFEDNPEDTKGGSRISPNSEKAVLMSAKLLGVDPEELRQALVSKVMQTSRGGIKGTVIMVPLKVYEANNARDALAKAIYSKLFDHIVARINKSIPFKASSYYIGVLDIAGFEYFKVNSFEQFCINYCNEKLQQFFNERILKYEQDLYARESLNVPKISYVDNQDCIDLIESKSNGIFRMLDEESKLPTHSFAHFTSEVHRAWNGHFRITLPRSSRLKAHRELRDDEGFVIRHYAGGVCYQTNQFIEKNNDALHASLEALIQESNNNFLRTQFANNSSQKGKLTFISVGSKFKTQLGELMGKLKSNGTNFIRCIKPNNDMVAHQFDGNSILGQLRCSGMTSVLELMEHGYPSRVTFQELYNMYKSYLPPELAKLDPRFFCEALLHSLKLNKKDFKFGITRVFFKPGKFAEFDKIMKSDPENLQKLVANVKKWLLRSRWNKMQFCALSVIKLKNKIIYRRYHLIILQKTARMFIAKKQHRPRIKGLVKIKNLQSQLIKIQDISNQLKNRDKYIADINQLQLDLESSIRRIKEDSKIKAAEIDTIYTNLVNQMNKQMASLQDTVKQEKIAEEQARLKKIQQELELEKNKKEEEERKKKEDEDNRKKKLGMEVRRKAEEQQRKMQEFEDRKAVADIQAQLEKEAIEKCRYRELLEQERRDHELAVRLAQESNGQVEDSPPPVRNGSDVRVPSTNNNRLIRSEQVRNHQAAMINKKYDLSKWKYSELRDAINTSCDIELLEACRHEFHRRLKVYHAWKARNRRKTIMDENERAPKSIMEAAARTPRTSLKQTIVDSSQRYFRIPFVRPPASNQQDNSHTGKRGWWYAHFDGQYVARQMELHPDKPPILLLAGVDDMQMCELSLEETGLTRKRGAEILEHEFNREWERHGGKPYISACDRKK